MKKPAWAPFPHPDEAYDYAGAALKKHWRRLHAGDCEPYPADAALQEAWRAYHRGDFAQAAGAGLEAGLTGYTVANKATAIYANYLEPEAARRLELFQKVADRCEEQARAEPRNPNAYYLLAYALGRYGQQISVARALAQGLGGRVRDALKRALELQPQHADAHIAMGTYHAEVIDKVGAMMGALTYGASKEEGNDHFEQALRLNPDSAIARIEYANGLVMMFGKAKMARAEQLYAEAAACTPVDAMERLDVELAKSELED